MPLNIPLHCIKYGLYVLAVEYVSRKIYTYIFSEEPSSYQELREDRKGEEGHKGPREGQKIAVDVNFTRTIETKCERYLKSNTINTYAYRNVYNSSSKKYDYSFVPTTSSSYYNDFYEVIVSDSKIPVNLGCQNLDVHPDLNLAGRFTHKKADVYFDDIKTHIIEVKQRLYLTGTMKNGIFIYKHIKTHEDLYNPDDFMRRVVIAPVHVYLLYIFSKGYLF